MNKVYLSGTVFDQPQLINKPDAQPHITFRLMVSHRSKAGLQKELYPVSAWGACAAYCHAQLRLGMRVALEGYLTQRPVSIGEKTFTAVGVTLHEIFLPTHQATAPATGGEQPRSEGDP